MREIRCDGPFRHGWGVCNTLLMKTSTGDTAVVAVIETKCVKCKTMHLLRVPAAAVVPSSAKLVS